MIGRLVKVQVLVFLLASAVGITYVGVRYVGLGDDLLGNRYTVHIELPETGGLYPDAPVTYRGVPIGQVGSVELVPGGVRADLRLDAGIRVPADLWAVVALRSAVGEQYLDLRPNRDSGPYLADGDTIPRERTGMPLPVESLIAGLDALVASVGADDLAILIAELGKAFEGNEEALRRLLDASSLLLADAHEHLPETLALLQDGRTVLVAQAESADAIRRWAASLARLAETLREADPDLRRLLVEGPPAAVEVMGLLRDLDPTVGTLLGNLITVNGIAVRRLDGIEMILVTFPITVSGGFTVVPGDGTAHLGLVLNVSDPPACTYAASGMRRCTSAEVAAGASVRGERAAPRAGGGGEASSPGSSASGSSASGSSASGSTAPGSSSPVAGPAAAPAPVAGFDPATGLVIGADGRPLQFGGTGGQYRLAGEESWKQLLIAGLAP